MAKIKEANDIKNKLKQVLLNSYYQKVHAQILPLEKLRVILLFVIIFAYITLFSILYYIISSIKILWNNEHSIILIAVIVIISFIPIFNNALKEYYKRKIKKFYPQIIESIRFNYRSRNNVYNLLNVIRNSRLFPTATQSKEDDIFHGKYKDVEITIAETRILDCGFNGIIITFDFNKKIKSTTFIKPKIDLLFRKILQTKNIITMISKNFIQLFWTVVGLLLIVIGIYYIIQDKNLSNALPSLLFGIAFLCTFGWWFYKSAVKEELINFKGLQKLMLEDVNFSKYYQAYSYDQVEGRYLITTAFIDRFTYLGEAFHTKKLRCSFVNNNLVIAIESNKDEFEICGLFTSLKNPKHIDKFVNRIVAILLIADYFKLNEKTGL